MFKHPSDVCMTYLEHMEVSLNFSKQLFIGSVQAFIHAFIPDIYITSTTDICNKIQKQLKSYGCDSFINKSI